MPKEITHCLFAERSIHSLAASLFPDRRKVGHEVMFLFEKFPQALYFGSVSPDIFYYDIATPWEKKGKARGALWGDLIHGAHGEDSLSHVREMLAVLRDAQLQAPLTGGRPLNRDEHGILTLFVMGYLSHVALDTLLHPIVYYYSGNYYAEDRAEKLRSEARHRAIETIFDLYNLERSGSDLKTYRSRAKLYLNDNTRELVLGLFTLSLLRAWPGIAEAEFGKREIPADIRQHALFTVAHRSYKKQLLFNKFFQNRQVARFGLWLNRRRADAMHYNSSLLYPAISYREYLRRTEGSSFTIEQLKDYCDPVDNKLHELSIPRLERRIVARTQGFYRTVWSYLSGSSSDAGLARVLRGYSLNNGRVGVPTSAMRHFAPLAIDGNFEFLKKTGSIQP